MAHERFSEGLNDEFAEKCRAALQKSWGIEIPAPKSFGKKENFQKNQLKGEKNVRGKVT